MGSFGGDYEGAHVLAMPLPQQGHIIPMLRFTTALAQKGLTVSFVCYEGEIPLLAASSGADDASSELPTSLDSFRFVMVRKPRQEDPAGYLEPATVFGEAFEPLLQKLLHDKSAGVSAGPTCVISDALLAFSQVRFKSDCKIFFMRFLWIFFIFKGLRKLIFHNFVRKSPAKLIFQFI